MSIAAWCGEEGGDSKVGGQLLRARVRASLTDVLLGQGVVGCCCVVRGGIKRRLGEACGVEQPAVEWRSGVWETQATKNPSTDIGRGC